MHVRFTYFYAQWRALRRLNLFWQTIQRIYFYKIEEKEFKIKFWNNDSDGKLFEITIFINFFFFY